MEESKKMIKSRGLRITQQRLEIMEILRKSSVALSELEIRNKLSDRIDRSTIFRNLKTLYDHKLLEKVFIEGISKYLPGLSDNDADMHLHFQCESCHQMFCLKDIGMELPELPLGFVPGSGHLLITGICKSCNTEKQS